MSYAETFISYLNLNQNFKHELWSLLLLMSQVLNIIGVAPLTLELQKADGTTNLTIVDMFKSP